MFHQVSHRVVSLRVVKRGIAPAPWHGLRSYLIKQPVPLAALSSIMTTFPDWVVFTQMHSSRLRSGVTPCGHTAGTKLSGQNPPGSEGATLSTAVVVNTPVTESSVLNSVKS